MNARKLVLAAAAMAAVAVTAFSQGTVVVHDPTVQRPETKLTADEQASFDRAMPAVRKMVPKETCDQEPEVSGVAHGSFTRAGARQALVFYQYCQTGNGLGWVGLILIDGGKVAGSFVSDSGWSMDVERVPDINKNGIDEFTLAFGGGMHQGQGGVGVDLMEFAGGGPKGLGWYKAEEFDDTQATTVWKLTARPARVPVFYKQKFFSGEDEKYKAKGRPVVTKLGKAYGTFERVR